MDTAEPDVRTPLLDREGQGTSPRDPTVPLLTEDSFQEVAERWVREKRSERYEPFVKDLDGDDDCRCCPPRKRCGGGACCSSKRCPCCCCCSVRCSRVPEVALVSFVATFAVLQFAYTPATFLLEVTARNVMGPFLFLFTLLVYFPVILIRSMGCLQDKYNLPWDRFRRTVTTIMLCSCGVFLLGQFLLIPDAVNISHELSQGLSISSDDSDAISFVEAGFYSLAVYGSSGSRNGDYEPEEMVYKTDVPEPTAGYNNCGSSSRDWTGQLKLDLYVPEGSGPFKIIFHAHGGAWRWGHKSMAAWSFEYFLDRGFAIVSSEYSLACWGASAENMIVDLEDALDFVRSANVSTAHNLDTSHVHLVGDSAGGHLVMLMAYKRNLPYVKSVFNNYGPSDLNDWKVWWWSGLGYDHCSDENDGSTVGGGLLYTLAGGSCASDAIAAISPITHVTATVPPTVTFAGTLDSMVPYDQAMGLHDQLDAFGVKNALIRVLGGEHCPEIGYYSVPGQMQRYAMLRLIEGTSDN